MKTLLIDWCIASTFLSVYIYNEKTTCLALGHDTLSILNTKEN